MGQGRLIVACDFGTVEFKALVTEIGDSGQLQLVGHSRQPAAGFHDGDFVDLLSGSRCIARTMRALEQSCDIYVSGFTYNISGSHLHSVRSTAQIPIGPGPRPIRERDIVEAVTRARSMPIPFDHKILTVNPVEYAVDRVRGIVDPRGRVGSQLEIQAHLITGSRSVLHNIENAIETAKYTPLGDAVDVLATARAVLRPEEQEQGVMLVDVGGRSTAWAVYRKGTIIANGAVPWGGEHLTADLCHGLRIGLEDAERVKCLRGVALRSLVEDASIEALFEKDSPEETPGLVAAILEPRLEEILTLVKKDFGDRRELANLGAGVVLTGGGSLCRGTDQLCEEIFELPVLQRNEPLFLRGAQRLPAGNWTTVAGLSAWAASDLLTQPEADEAESEGGLWGRVRGWFRRSRSGDEELVGQG